jgi:hypothetical protein
MLSRLRQQSKLSCHVMSCHVMSAPHHELSQQAGAFCTKVSASFSNVIPMVLYQWCLDCAIGAYSFNGVWSCVMMACCVSQQHHSHQLEAIAATPLRCCASVPYQLAVSAVIMLARHSLLFADECSRWYLYTHLSCSGWLCALTLHCTLVPRLFCTDLPESLSGCRMVICDCRSRCMLSAVGSRAIWIEVAVRREQCHCGGVTVAAAACAHVCLCEHTHHLSQDTACTAATVCAGYGSTAAAVGVHQLRHQRSVW